MTTSTFQHWRTREMATILLLALLSVFLWRVPWLGIIFYPFHLFGTFVHELSHGFATILTGGEFVRFVVHSDFSGVATRRGGTGWIVTSAGYVGSTLFGGLLIVISAWGVKARHVLTALGTLLGIMCLLYVRNLFGMIAGIGLAAGLIAAGVYIPRLWADGLLLFLAVQSILGALDSVFGLITLSTSHHQVLTDAQIMAQRTFIPAVFWALLWSILSVGILVGSLNLAYRRKPRSRV